MKREETKVNNSVLNKASGNAMKGYRTGLAYITWGAAAGATFGCETIKWIGEQLAQVKTVQEFRGVESNKSAVRIGREDGVKLFKGTFGVEDFIKAAKEVEEETKE